MKNSEISITQLALKLPKYLATRKGLKRGHLYHALRLVAEAYQKEIRIKENKVLLVGEYRIEEQFTLLEDDKVLQKLGFPNPYLQEKKGLFSSFIEEREHVNYLVVTAASFIVLSFSKPVANSQAAQPPNVSTDSKSAEGYQHAAQKPKVSSKTPPLPVAVLKVRPLSLALVVKGKESEKISNNVLDLDQLKILLGNASHFICASQPEVSRIEQELNVTSEIDQKSERAVLMVINYEGKLEEGKTFANKLELNQHLRKQNSKYEVVAIKTLLEVSNLCKLGFIRS